DLEAVAAQTRHVQENIGQAVVGHDEAVALGYVEPLDDAGQLHDAGRFISDVADSPVLAPGVCARLLWPHFVRRHDAARVPLCRLFRAVLRILATKISPSRRGERLKCVCALKHVDIFGMKLLWTSIRWCESVDDEGGKYGTDVLPNHQISG